MEQMKTMKTSDMRLISTTLSPSLLECIFVMSIELNVFGLVYVVTKKLVKSYYGKESKIPEPTVFACEDAAKSKCYKRKEHIVARTIVNTLCSTILFGLSADILTSTHFVTQPYIGINCQVEFGISSLVSFSVFNLLLTLTTGQMRKGKIHNICRHIVAVCTLLTSVCFNENSLSPVVALIMMGSIFLDELKVIFQIFEKNTSSLYNLFSLAHLAVNFLCQFFLPITIIVVVVMHSRQQFFDTHPLTQTMFFLSMTFFFWHNIWWLRKITYSYMTERAKLYIIKTARVSEPPTNVNIFSEWGNREYRTTLEKRVQGASQEENREGEKWTTIDLTF